MPHATPTRVSGATEARFRKEATEARDALVRALNDVSNAARAAGDTGIGYATNVPDTFYNAEDNAPCKIARVRLLNAPGGKTIMADFGVQRGHGYWTGLVSIYEFHGSPIASVQKAGRTEKSALEWVLKSLRD